MKVAHEDPSIVAGKTVWVVREIWSSGNSQILISTPIQRSIKANNHWSIAILQPASCCAFIIVKDQDRIYVIQYLTRLFIDVIPNSFKSSMKICSTPWRQGGWYAVRFACGYPESIKDFLNEDCFRYDRFEIHVQTSVIGFDDLRKWNGLPRFSQWGNEIE